MVSNAMVVSLITRATPEQYGVVYRAHVEPLLRFAWLLCGDRDQAEDVVAEAFARVFGPVAARSGVRALRLLAARCPERGDQPGSSARARGT
jgi:DNA-directed RNA polymerase specialized sigma24 family protein